MKASIIMVIFSVSTIYAGRFDLYEHPDGQGRRIALDIPEHGCSNAINDYHFNDIASSINTRGQCVILCADLNCQGRCVKFSGGTDNTCRHSDFGDCNFHDQATSMKNCYQ